MKGTCEVGQILFLITVAIGCNFKEKCESRIPESFHKIDYYDYNNSIFLISADQREFYVNSDTTYFSVSTGELLFNNTIKKWVTRGHEQYDFDEYEVKECDNELLVEFKLEHDSGKIYYHQALYIRKKDRVFEYYYGKMVNRNDDNYENNTLIEFLNKNCIYKVSENCKWERGIISDVR